MLPRGTRIDWMLALPLLLFSLYGTNVPLPFQKSRYVWVALVAASAAWMALVWKWQHEIRG
jgi:Mg2+ and Co2+ transporter CorA